MSEMAWIRCKGDRPKIKIGGIPICYTDNQMCFLFSFQCQRRLGLDIKEIDQKLKLMEYLSVRQPNVLFVQFLCFSGCQCNLFCHARGGYPKMRNGLLFAKRT